jgi:hypothetical protein
LTLLDVGGAELEHAIEQSGELVSPGVNGDGCAQAAFDILIRRVKAPIAVWLLMALHRHRGKGYIDIEGQVE